jgi:hypothetical protein
LLPIIGQSLGNQHAAIISSMLYNTEFFNRIGRELPFDSGDFCPFEWQLSVRGHVQIQRVGNPRR